MDLQVQSLRVEITINYLQHSNIVIKVSRINVRISTSTQRQTLPLALGKSQYPLQHLIPLCQMRTTFKTILNTKGAVLGLEAPKP